MLIKKQNDIKSSEITDEKIFRQRRQILLAAAAAFGATACKKGVPEATPPTQSETLTSLKDITSYNNYYEFGTDKSDPAANAQTLITNPWTVNIEGEVNKPKKFDLDELLKIAPPEERIYRLRCVEGWSMVIPWMGFPLNALLKIVEPNSNAKFVQFATLYDKQQMPLGRLSGLTLPYVEGLRMDEAMHPLTILATGLYGKSLPNQNGAPIRLVVPWKYGFKSIKSIVNIRLMSEQPRTTWNMMASDEYGFYSNVNPEVPHPRWSQATERRLPEFFKGTKTQMFNGYVDQVASMYNGMDLRKNF
jgi:methionine sulfoxide reductase catalytic subunit